MSTEGETTLEELLQQSKAIKAEVQRLGAEADLLWAKVSKLARERTQSSARRKAEPVETT
jgi:hypothetical protein